MKRNARSHRSFLKISILAPAERVSLAGGEKLLAPFPRKSTRLMPGITVGLDLLGVNATLVGCRNIRNGEIHSGECRLRGTWLVQFSICMYIQTSFFDVHLGIRVSLAVRLQSLFLAITCLGRGRIERNWRFFPTRFSSKDDTLPLHR